MGWIATIILGGIAGWLASMVMGRNASMGIFWNIVVGIVGSFIGNSVFSFLLSGGEIGAWPPDIMGIVSALIGAIVLLGVVNLIKRGSVR